MEAHELSTSQSFITGGDSVLLNASRLAPRKFDITLLKPSKQDLMIDSSASQSILHQKLALDQTNAATQRDEESRIRFELECSKQSLLEQYQLIHTKLCTELNDCKRFCEQKIQDREAFWSEQVAEKQIQLTKLEAKLNDIVEMSRKRIAEKEKINIEQLEQQEVEWKIRLEEAERRHQEILNSLHSKHVLEKESRELAEKARVEAREDQIRAIYEKKMKKIEAQVQEVMRNYHDKELIIHGSLDEARKEIVLMRAASAAREDSLREELAIKDRLILSLQKELHKVDDITTIADSWRAAARDLARMVVQACVSIQDMPAVPIAPKESSNNLFQGFGKPEELSKEKYAYLMEVKAVNRLRKEHVLIQKELIARTLRNSKVDVHIFSLL